MPNSERGLYEPSDDGRVFDASEDEEDTEGSRLPLLIMLALLVLAAFGGVVYLAYKQGVASGRGDPPILVAESGPAKVAPTEVQSGQTPNQGLKIYEQPAPSDEGAEPAQAAPAAAVPATPPAVAPAAPPAVVAKVEPPVAKPAPIVAAPKPAPVQATPLPPPTKPAASPPTVATAAPKPLAPSAPAATAPGSGAYMLQIGSFKSQADANTAWKNYQAKHSALLTGYGPDIKQADLGEKGIWYRLRIGSFGDREVATALCERLKANSGSCILAAR